MGGGGDEGTGKTGAPSAKASKGASKDGDAKAKDKSEARGAPKKDKPKSEPKKNKPSQVTFKVWGTASAGVDTTYGSDTENIQGGGLPMTKTLPLNDDAMYYMVNAQLQGGGDIHCSVTVDGKTKKGHAQGGYNICNAQLNAGLFDDWS